MYLVPQLTRLLIKSRAAFRNPVRVVGQLRVKSVAHLQGAAYFHGKLLGRYVTGTSFIEQLLRLVPFRWRGREQQILPQAARLVRAVDQLLDPRQHLFTVSRQALVSRLCIQSPGSLLAEPKQLQRRLYERPVGAEYGSL